VRVFCTTYQSYVSVGLITREALPILEQGLGNEDFAADFKVLLVSLIEIHPVDNRLKRRNIQWR
jgi:hypothetical protein